MYSRLRQEVDVAFADRGLGRDSDFTIVVVDPLTLFLDVRNKVATMDARAQMSDETLERVNADIGFGVFESVLLFLGLTHLVDDHLVVLRVGLIHVTEDPVHRALHIVVALPKPTLGLLVG